jgi:hypothetical protein
VTFIYWRLFSVGLRDFLPIISAEEKKTSFQLNEKESELAVFI